MITSSHNRSFPLIKNNKPDFGYRFTVPIAIHSGGGYFYCTLPYIRSLNHYCACEEHRRE